MILEVVLLIFITIIIISVMAWILHPPQVLSKKKLLGSHLFLIAGIILLNMWIFMSGIVNALLLAGAIWTIGGGICVIVVYVLRSQTRNQNT
jgi:hypothetical protein